MFALLKLFNRFVPYVDVAHAIYDRNGHLLQCVADLMKHSIPLTENDNPIVRRFFSECQYQIDQMGHFRPIIANQSVHIILHDISRNRPRIRKNQIRISGKLNLIPYSSDHFGL